MINLILCPKSASSTWHAKRCIERTSAVCGDDSEGNWLGWLKLGECSALRRGSTDANYHMHE